MDKKDECYASAFLCHASCSDKQLAREVAVALGRRGVVPWLDKLSLLPGESISITTDAAIEASTVLVVFLSQAAKASDWVREEIKRAIRNLGREDARRRIILVHPGASADTSLVPDVLKPIVLHSDHNDIDVHKVMSADKSAAAIAKDIGKRVYDLLDTAGAMDVNVVLDQRGSGDRVGVPPEVGRLKLARPTLVFRHDVGARDRKGMLCGEAWTGYRRDLCEALDAALPTHPGRTVHVAGTPQLGLAVMLGWHMRRSSNVTLRVHGRQDGNVFTNNGQQMVMAPSSDHPPCNTIHPVHAPALSGTPDEIDLVLAPKNRLENVARYRAAAGGALPPVVWIETGKLSSSKEVMVLTVEVAALLAGLGGPAVRLYSALPAHALPIVVANFDTVVKRLRFMEYDHGAGERGEGPEGWYRELAVSGAHG